jgi:hypothetical protein
MVKSFLISLILVSFSAHADLFGFGSESGSRESKIPQLVEKLKGMEMRDDPAFEETFNQNIKAIENGVEEEKLFCSGEASDSSGKTLPAAQKQLCMRELKKHYLEAMNTIFDLKKKYLGYIHQRQMEKLSDIQKKLKADIEKNF